MATIIDRTKQTSSRFAGTTRKRWTVRYAANGRQSERSFATKAEAEAFRAKVDNDTRDGSYIDPELSRIPFTPYARGVIAGMDVGTGSHKRYLSIFRTWIEPWAAGRTLAQVCADREGLSRVVNVSMAHLTANPRRLARYLAEAVADEAVAAGRLPAHRLAGVKVTRGSAEVTGPDKSFVFPSRGELEALAASLNGSGLAVWLMRGCGLRISEALAVEREDFSADGSSLRVSGQASLDGRRKVALKHRRPGEYRDVPVPAYVWAMVKDLPPGPVLPGKDGARYQTYYAIQKKFDDARKLAGIADGFTQHSLRHAFVSALLHAGVPLSEVAGHVGHRSIAVTHAVYGHMLPAAPARAREALDAEFSTLA